MSDNILFPTTEELAALSGRVGGLVFARYSFPAADLTGVKKMAVQIAAGQTLGFVPDDLPTYINYVGRVVETAFSADQRGDATIAFPGILFGDDIAGLLTVLFGKTSFAPGLRLETIRGDDNFLSKLKGPKFGMQGVRKIVRRNDDSEHNSSAASRPLLMAILKPGIGPSDDPLAIQFAKLVGAGTDLVKDDETRIDLSLDDALHRLKKVLAVGQGRGMYVMHLSGPAFELKNRAIKLQQAGAQAFLFCPYTYGIGLMQALCADPEITVPIFAHPAFTGVMGQGPSSIAMEIVLGTLMRWAGADGVLFPSPYGSIALPAAEARAIHAALCRPEGKLKMSASIPSAGIMPEFVEKIRQDFGIDVVVNAGTGMARTGMARIGGGIGGGIEDGAKAFLREIEAHYK